MTVDRYRARSYYRGRAAREYLERRESTRQWRREQQLVGRLLADLAPGESILDVPYGTGRFLTDYGSRDHRAYGVDISLEMLRVANAHRPGGPPCLVGDAMQLPLRDGAVDHVVCIRFVNWLPLTLVPALLTELRRVARQRILIEVHQAESIRHTMLIGRFLQDLLTDPARLVRGLQRTLERAVRRSPAAPEAEPGGGTPKYHYHPQEEVERLIRRHRLAVKGIVEILRTTAYRELQDRRIVLYVLERAEQAT